MKLKEKKKRKKKEKRGCKCKWSGGNLELHAGIGQPAGRVSQWPRSGSSARNEQRGSGGLGWKPPGERRVLGRAWAGGICAASSHSRAGTRPAGGVTPARSNFPPTVDAVTLPPQVRVPRPQPTPGGGRIGVEEV